MERNEKTRALLAAFGCALAYLLAGKALTAVLPQVPEEAARMWAFVHRCAAAPIVEELVFRGIIQQLARPLGERQAVALQAVLFAVQHRGPAGMAYALVCGLVLGVAGMFIIPDYPAQDYITSAAVGIVSGLAATGVNQITKQLKDKVEDSQLASSSAAVQPKSSGMESEAIAALLALGFSAAEASKAVSAHAAEATSLDNLIYLSLKSAT